MPAYLGQLTAVAVAASAVGAPPSRWTALRHATAYVLGFGIVFTVLGVTATFAAAGLAQYMPDLRKVAGLVLIVLGLSMIGLLRIPFLEQDFWRPLDAGASAGLATARGGLALAPAGGPAGAGPGMGDRLGTRLASNRSGLAASFLLGTVFAVGWTRVSARSWAASWASPRARARSARAASCSSATRSASGFRSLGRRRLLRPGATADPAARPPRPNRDDHRRAPRHRHRCPDAVRVLYLIIVWFPFNTGV